MIALASIYGMFGVVEPSSSSRSIQLDKTMCTVSLNSELPNTAKLPSVMHDVSIDNNLSI